MSADTAGILFLAGAFVGILAVLIKYAGWTPLIAGYDPDRIEDEDGLANFVGSYALAVAALTILVGVLEYVDPGVEPIWYWLPYLVAVLALAARLLTGSRRFEASADAGARS